MSGVGLFRADSRRQNVSKTPQEKLIVCEVYLAGDLHLNLKMRDRSLCSQHTHTHTLTNPVSPSESVVQI